MSRPTRIARSAVFDWLGTHHRAGLYTVDQALEALYVAVDRDEIPALLNTRKPDRADLRAMLSDFNAPVRWATNGIGQTNRTEPPPLWRTLDDIPDDPPQPLLLGFVDPDGPTLAYAAPGTGKGMTFAHLIVKAQAVGMKVAVYDAERRPREWARRVSGLGGDRSRVVYVDPSDLGPAYAGQPFWEVAPGLAKIIRASGSDLLLCDSILPAVSMLGEDSLKSDPTVPWNYAKACETLGVPSLSSGHPPKGQPEGEPFGSFAWVAAFRLTWLGTHAEGSGHVIRWKVKKANERAHVAGIRLTIQYGDDGRPFNVIATDDTENTRDWLLAELAHGPRTVADLAEEMLGELEEPPAGELERIKSRLGQALLRLSKEDGSVQKVTGGTTGRTVRWELTRGPIRILAGPA